MEKVKLYNSRKVGSPPIILPVPGRNEVTIPAEGAPEKGTGELIDGAKGVEVMADRERLLGQAALIHGLVVK